MTKITITIKDPKTLTTIQKLKVIRRAILWFIKQLEKGEKETNGFYYEDYEHTGSIINATIK
jgi:hypothetical protein